MTTLKDLYIEELQDLWSANDQMKSVVSTMAGRAKDTSLGDRLRRCKRCLSGTLSAPVRPAR